MYLKKDNKKSKNSPRSAFQGANTPRADPFACGFMPVCKPVGTPSSKKDSVQVYS